MSERSHRSIGEVLALLQDDFPDVTISKIRFLESQGLVEPERTQSGYRKFSDDDVERLRWILRQQRENFLPLKVIKDRLAAGELDGVDTGAPVDADPPGVDAVDPVPDPIEPEPVAAPAPPAAPRQPAAPAAAPEVAAASADPALLQEAPIPRSSREHATLPDTRRRPRPPLLQPGATAVSMTLDELMESTGLSARDIGDLERFGMISNRTLGGTTYYDEDAVVVAQLAAAFRGHGIEARHLRMYKVAAEREAGVFEQLLSPLARKRSPTARQESAELVNELAALGDGLRAAMLRQLLREFVDGV